MFYRIAAAIILITVSVTGMHLAFAKENPEQTEIQWQEWSNEIFARAKTENKLILLDLMTESCQFCKKMDATTYQDKQVITNIQQHYIPVRVDRDRNHALARQYARYSTPATIIYNDKGEEVIKRIGYIQPRFMYWMLEAVTADPSPDAHK
ncbi:MAG: DUF255 domain-containing protein [Gammaproteobacteria bacterium]|nr:DUF255 domain-containing protein [Gammaproteobacteria bacterium]